jgi:hypothetical protein
MSNTLGKLAGVKHHQLHVNAPEGRRGDLYPAELRARTFRMPRVACGGSRECDGLEIALVAGDLAEIEAEEEFGDGSACVLVSGDENVGCESRLAKVLSGLLAYLAFKAGIDGNEESGLTFVDMGFRVVESHGEDLRGWQVHMNGAANDVDVRGSELIEIDAGESLSVDFEENAVAGKKRRQETAFAVAGDHLVHRIGHGFEAGEPADLRDDRWLRNVNAGDTSRDQRREAIPNSSSGSVKECRDDDDACHYSGETRQDDCRENACSTSGVNRHWHAYWMRAMSAQAHR